jgi:chaperonin cofactor prefoldin
MDQADLLDKLSQELNSLVTNLTKYKSTTSSVQEQLRYIKYTIYEEMALLPKIWESKPHPKETKCF